ncbi:MAG: n-acetylglutamate synthase [Croceivirga sp.]
MMTINIDYNNRKFKPIQTSSNAETSEETIFWYKQDGNILTCSYKGGKIIRGHLIGLVRKEGVIDMRYHQINRNGELTTGLCLSIPEIMKGGKIRLHETWQWTSGDQSQGSSVLEEIDVIQ